MSRLLGNALPVFRLWTNDVAHADEQWFGSHTTAQPPMLLSTARGDELEAYGWATPWWPTRGGLMGGRDGVAENQFLVTPWWGDPWLTSGCNGRLAFVGYTRDQHGSPLGGCTVRCFRTATNELVSTVTSDANGYYIATSPHADGHYLVVHKAGSPEIAGASVSTLLPG